jgi:hypothetical protein
LAPFREADRRALLRPDDFRELLRAELRPPFLADFRADFLLLFLADFLADFLAPFRAEDFLARLDFRDAFLADFRRGEGDLPRVLEESSKSLYDAGVEAGVGAGVFSIGSGSIQPEPDQPISIK